MRYGEVRKGTGKANGLGGGWQAVACQTNRVELKI